MVWFRFLWIILICGGCALKVQEKDVYVQGYRKGAREQMDRIVDKFQGNHFPYYQWSTPIVQEVKVPAHIAGGAFVPEHKELVIIKPGEWMRESAYPIDNQEKGHEQNVQPSAHEHATDITYLPSGSK
jgi:hypothetical protein